MNAKKAKALRATLKASGFDFRDAKYQKTNEHAVVEYVLDKDGKRIKVDTGVTAHTAVLNNCGRQLYKQLKKVAA